MQDKNSSNQFSSKIGLVAATLGSAVGLGSIWRFPAEAQENGGGAFLLVYLACVLLLGIPVMVAEMSIGRSGGFSGVMRSGYGADSLRPKKNPWRGAIMFGVISSYMILTFYMVVAGWTFEYLVDSITGSLYSGVTSVTSDAGIEATFHNRMEEYIASDWAPLLSTWIVIGMNVGILMLGVKKGIERASNIMMPILFVLLLIFGIYALTLSGSAEGLKFFYRPDFSKFSWSMIVNALGQTFFSLSLGTGILITYASYYPRDTKLTRTSATVSLLTTVVALMMGMIIFPAIFTYGLDIHAVRGTTLVFVTLPEVFAKLPGSQWWSILFFTLLLVSALTSTISIAEVSVAFVQRHFRRTRLQATLIVLLPLMIFSSLCSLSFGRLADVSIFGLTIFNFLDTFTTNYMLPLTALVGVVYIGWFSPAGTLRNEITNYGSTDRIMSPIMQFIIRYPAPILIFIILMTGIFGHR
ncbi:MAG: sodium-dependent transporter [Muribaculaceae bacterium]|nr:sodium-dependent transporter [Muribaculaceae bacterium]